ncbi:HNH endonuclease [Kitasatospora phosalacinea]|uniref:HNH endonuclease n=1 Tax=Kitasatospora phosalacinea TaxID=2065 RepID=UPI000691F33C|nr:HNH endonuclease signature motif containing protein [Kitasatospora phosalacinea]
MEHTGTGGAVPGRRAWSFLVAGAEREFQGNTGYEDVIEESYSYDSTVANHQKVTAGDLVVVRNGREALGTGYVERIDVLTDCSKERNRCPECGDTSFKERTRKQPRYWCSRCSTAFNEPTTEIVAITAYRAHYGRTWQPLEGCLEKALLGELSLSKSGQQSIRAMDLVRTLDAVTVRGVRFPHESSIGRTAPRPTTELPGGRRRTTAAVRRGQDAFRSALVRQYGMICAVTGPAPAEVLEAAHLKPFAETERHRIEEGLLLRADIHRLFDSGLLAISPELQVHIAPSLRGHVTYGALDGSLLQVGADGVLDLAVVEEQYTATVSTW